MSSTRPSAASPAVADPVAILKALTGLRQIISLYPVGHPIVEQAIQVLEDELEPAWHDSAVARIDVIRGDAHLNGVPFRLESRQQEGVLHEFLALGFDSIHVTRGVTREELRSVADLMVGCKDGGPSSSARPGAGGGRRPARHARTARGARHPLHGAAMAGGAHSARPRLRRLAQDGRGDLRGRCRRESADRGRRARPAPVADVQGGGQHGGARADPGGEAVREPHLLPLGERLHPQPPPRPAHRPRRGRPQAAVVEGALLHDVGKTRFRSRSCGSPARSISASEGPSSATRRTAPRCWSRSRASTR